MAGRSAPTQFGTRTSPVRHPSGGRVRDEPPKSAWPLSRGWTLVLSGLAVLFALLRGVYGLAADSAEPSIMLTERVVVVGVTGRPQLTEADRTILTTRLESAQVGSMAARGRYVPDCAAAGWTTLGAGRRAAVGGLCDPVIADGVVTDWAARQAAAAARNGDAQLGTLANSVPGCVAAVGPGAGLAAARPDGTIADYSTPQQFVDGGLDLPCPVTLIDAEGLSDRIIAGLAKNDSVTLIVTGIGPAPGTLDRDLQVIYEVDTALPGWLTSASTRRQGIVTLTDLTRTLIDFSRPDNSPVPLVVDGSPFEFYQAALSIDGIEDQLAATAALSDAAPIAYLGVGILGSVLGLVMVAGVIVGRLSLTRLILTLSTVWAASMMLTGVLPWQRSESPGIAAISVMIGWTVILTGSALLLARSIPAPAAITGAALTVAAFTIDAALGGALQPGSLLNSRPIFGLRWYGFGNVTFASYAAAGLILAGYVGHRFILAGQRRAAVVAVAAIGGGIVICEGWPTMGSDFGGVIALSPAVLWLALAISGVRITWPRLLIIAGSAVVAVGLISVLDWARGPDRRSHLGNFIQRIIDGDALDVVSRKAVAAYHSLTGPLGIGALIIGVGCWVVIFRYAMPLVRQQFGTIYQVLVALLGTAILGALVNDGGGSVWLTVTAYTTLTVAWFCADYAMRRGWTIGPQSAVRR
jgi:hypothetical protein